VAACGRERSGDDRLAGNDRCKRCQNDEGDEQRLVASRKGFSFHLSYVGRDLPDSGGTGFETAAMRRLYDYGYEKARSGASWETKLPPHFPPDC